jgi:hypothetical protein
MIAVFYALVALIALAGQASGATETLGWPVLPAVAAVAALEFGGVILSRHALQRMKLGETAFWARFASATVAAFAVGFNWLTHGDHKIGGFFAFMSALGYAVWLLDSNARRRDQLRAKKMLPELPPAYGLIRWLRHPVLTREARALAIEHPELGLHGSINAIAEARRKAAQRKSIAEVLHRKIRASVGDGTTADIATAVYDMDEVAARLADTADYDGLTALIAADLMPARIAGVVDAEVIDVEPVKTPLPPKQRKPRELTAKPTSGGPVIEWDVDMAVDMILRNASSASIMVASGASPKSLQRTRAIVEAIREHKVDADIVKPGNLTASFVARVRTSYEKAMANQ